MNKIKYRIECLPEYTDVRGNALASGNDIEDRAEENRILESLEWNQWAWCTVKVTAYIDGVELEGADYLGCCSYASEEDFKAGGYFEDMKHQAKEDLLNKIKATKEVELEAV